MQAIDLVYWLIIGSVMYLALWYILAAIAWLHPAAYVGESSKADNKLVVWGLFLPVSLTMHLMHYNNGRKSMDSDWVKYLFYGPAVVFFVWRDLFRGIVFIVSLMLYGTFMITRRFVAWTVRDDWMKSSLWVLLHADVGAISPDLYRHDVETQKNRVKIAQADAKAAKKRMQELEKERNMQQQLINMTMQGISPRELSNYLNRSGGKNNGGNNGGNNNGNGKNNKGQQPYNPDTYNNMTQPNYAQNQQRNNNQQQQQRQRQPQQQQHNQQQFGNGGKNNNNKKAGRGNQQNQGGPYGNSSVGPSSFGQQQHQKNQQRQQKPNNPQQNKGGLGSFFGRNNQQVQQPVYPNQSTYVPQPGFGQNYQPQQPNYNPNYGNGNYQPQPNFNNNGYNQPRANINNGYNNLARDVVYGPDYDENDEYTTEQYNGFVETEDDENEVVNYTYPYRG